MVGDLDGALQEALAALEEFEGQDEPLGTASAALTAGSLETTHRPLRRGGSTI